MVNIAKINTGQLDADVKGSPSSQSTHDESERYVAWLIPSVGAGDIEIVDLGRASDIDQAVHQLRVGIEKSPDQIYGFEDTGVDAAVTDPRNTLSQFLIRPLEPHLDGVNELILSPDGNLWLVPWSCLPLEDDSFMVEKYKIRYALSGRELVQQKRSRALVTDPVIFADPDYDLNVESQPATEQSQTTSSDHQTRAFHQTFSRLPGTAKEAEIVQGVVQKYSGRKPAIFLQSEATESRLKQLHRPELLILSTHGFFDELRASAGTADETGSNNDPSTRAASGFRSSSLFENPLLRCGLALAGCNNAGNRIRADDEDGILTGLEIVGCDFRGTKLVVLSACETGLGDIDNGEGVAGLRQSFQLAGSEAVLASLWEVPDHETTALMKSFWENLADGQTKSEALQNAQITAIQKIRSQQSEPYPYRWAAFTLTGQ